MSTTTAMRFALVSTVLSLPPLDALARASEAALADVAAAWSITAPTVRVVGSVAELQDDDVPVVILPTLDAPGDDAYHAISKQHPYALVLANGAPWDEITMSAFHEMAEALVDPAVNRYISGRALEVCDPVQDDQMSRDGVVLSAWVTPAWFGVGSGPTAVPSYGLAPGELRPGGYCMREDGTQEGMQRAAKRWAWSRRERRQRAVTRVALTCRDPSMLRSAVPASGST